MKILKHVPWILLVIGGLNWGLVGLFDFNLVTWIFDEGTTLTKLVYILIGLSAILSIFYCKKCKCPSCSTTTTQ